MQRASPLEVTNQMRESLIPCFSLSLSLSLSLPTCLPPPPSLPISLVLPLSLPLYLLLWFSPSPSPLRCLHTMGATAWLPRACWADPN